MPTSTQVDAILKDDYKPYRDQMNQKVWFFAQLEHKTDTIEGRIARHAIHTGRSGGFGARREGVAAPTADQQRFATVPVPIRNQQARIQLTKQLMLMADTNAGAFVDALEAEMSIDNDVMRDCNRQAFGTSNGVMATCTTTTTSTTVSLLSTTPTSAMRHFYIGRRVDIGTVASPQTIASDRQITAVDTVNKTITISGATVSTVASTHFIFNSNSGGASNNSGAQDDGQSELTGLQTIVSATAILHTVDPATQPSWKAQVYANGGTLRPIPEATMDLALLNAASEAGHVPSALVSGAGVYVAAKSVLSGYYRNIDTMKFKGGFEGIVWSTPGMAGIAGGQLGWMADPDCPPNTLYGLSLADLVVYQVGEGWQWFDDDGAILSRVPNQLSLEAMLYTFEEIACLQRNSHFVIQDIAEAS